MLSAGATLTSAGTLLFTGTAAPDTITVRVSGPQVVVHANGSMLQFPRGDVRRLRIVGGEGDDRLHGGAGDDTLIGAAGTNRVSTGSGENVFDSTANPSNIQTQRFGTQLNALDFSVILAGPGSRNIVYRTDNGALSWCLPDSDDTIDAFIGTEMTIDAGGGNDTFNRFEELIRQPDLTSDALENVRFDSTLIGGAGNDTWLTEENAYLPTRIVGGEGNDVVNDQIQLVGTYERIDLGAGRDSIFVGDDILGAPIVYAGAGVEHVRVTKSALIVYGNSLNNIIEIEPDEQQGTTVFGGRGDDVITSRGVRASISGDAGNDTLTGFGTLLGGSGNDTIIGAGTLLGGSGNDTLTGSDAFDDSLEGGDGDDVFFARDGRRDTIRGGTGFDTATADTVGGVIDLISEVEEVS